MQHHHRTRFASILLCVLAGAGCAADDADSLSPTPKPELSIRVEALPVGRPSVAYAASVTAMHGAPPYRWSIAAGALPPGLEVAADGTPATQITGTPQSTGAFEFTLRVEDADGDRAQGRFTLVVRDSSLPLSLITTGLPDGALATPYSTWLVASDGVPPYRWSRLGDLPPGLTLVSGSPEARLSGTPTRAGRFDFSVEVVDDIGDRVERSFSLSIAGDLPLRITTGAGPTIDFAASPLGRAFSGAVAAEGGDGPYRWAVERGTLPAGLQLDPDGTPQTFLRGTPTELGTFTGVITVTDARDDTDTKPFSLTVARPVQITTTDLPSAPTCVPFAASVTAREGSGAGYRWAVVAGALPAGLSLRATGTPSTMITGTPDRASLGTHNVTIQVTDGAGDTDTRSLTLDVIDTGERLTVGIAGDLEVDDRADLYLADLCGAVPTPAVRVSTDTAGSSVGVQVGAAQPTFSPDGRKLAFVLGRDAPGVYVSQVDAGVAGPPVRVTSAAWTRATLVRSLRFSGDSRRLAFVANGLVTRVDEMFVVDVSGPLTPDSAVVVNPEGNPDADVEWRWSAYAFSADSSRLAFVYDGARFQQNDLWVVDVDTLRPRSAVRATHSVTGGDVGFGHILAVPGSARFVINGDLLTDGVEELFLVDAAQDPPSTLRVSAPMPPNSSVLPGSTHFGITEDGTRLWYATHEGSVGGAENSGGAVWRVDLSSPSVATRLGAAAVSDSRIDQGVLVGGGRGLLVVGDLVSTYRKELFLFDLEGPADQPLAAARIDAPLPTGRGGVQDPVAVAPNGSWVAYSVGSPPIVYVVSILGATAMTPVAVSPAVLDFQPNLYRAAFAPDSSSVAFAARYASLGVNDAYVVSLNDGGPGPWRQLTSVARAGGVQGLFFASSSKLVLHGALEVRDDRDSFMIDLADPNPSPRRITDQYLPGRSDVEQVFIP